MESPVKRTYTVPIMLIIITGLAILCVVLYSRLLIVQQGKTTDEGQRLAESYLVAALMAERLHAGSDGLLKAETTAQKLAAKQLLGEAGAAGAGESLNLYSKAATFPEKPDSEDEEVRRAVTALNAIIGTDGKLKGIGEHDGELTDEEKQTLTIVRDSASEMIQALQRFRTPTGEAGYRAMTVGGEWVTAANEAIRVMEAAAAKLKP
ncbi:hypothetical protein ACFPVX_20465 [Cohnella faecalis]|uniref:Uncharacterized protein n=1 Tax=Cohnella faecalis TaxID=2315694 RepID=A0A398CLH8_9BACL|nr:hypothetical protein [Cohnella faecalis]RIE04196.1 hypothetical protein D3H35_06135 [Cohnella faecalis]